MFNPAVLAFISMSLGDSGGSAGPDDSLRGLCASTDILPPAMLTESNVFSLTLGFRPRPQRMISTINMITTAITTINQNHHWLNPSPRLVVPDPESPLFPLCPAAPLPPSCVLSFTTPPSSVGSAVG